MLLKSTLLAFDVFLSRILLIYTANVTKYNELLRSTAWLNITNYTNVSTVYSCFLNKYSETFKSCFLLKEIKESIKYAHKKLWLSTCLAKSMKEKTKKTCCTKNVLSPPQYHLMRVVSKDREINWTFLYVLKSAPTIKQSWTL